VGNREETECGALGNWPRCPGPALGRVPISPSLPTPGHNPLQLPPGGEPWDRGDLDRVRVPSLYRCLCISRRVCQAIILFLVVASSAPRSFGSVPAISPCTYNDLPLVLLSLGINLMANIHSSTHC